MMEESAVKVCIRVRPLISREESAALENAEPIQLLWKADKKSIHQIEDGNSSKSFSFDRVFTADETTMHLYQDIAKPLVVSTVEGYNGTIFAYGQTSSGKTFTMMGGNHMPGVIPLAVEDVFQTIKNYPKKEFLLRVSYMEIYNETVTDLLVDSWKRKPLEIRETTSKNIFVADLTEELVTSPAQAIAWIRKGEKNRHYGKTKMNQRSSRSHTIFRMILESRETSDPASGENTDGAILVSHLNLVDLAGSERASQTGSEGTRFKEGCNINRSLFTLGQVIKKLTDESQKGFTNYRDSKLTRILQNSLGGNAKTVIICTITPVTLDDTLSTLQFASTAKKMKNDPHLTEASDDEALLKRYRDEIVDLKRRLQEVSSFTQTTVTEKEVLSQLLQEKDQLQREQEDRIINLTKLLVTGSNISAVKKIPKRRVTWGGKMLRLARTSGCVSGSTDLSFAECFTHKKKADHSGWMELAEDDEDFDSHWEIPDEPSEMDTNRSTVAIRSFGDSPNESVSPDRLHEPSGKVSNLEMQLEMVSLQKEEAMKKLETLDGRMAALQLKLQTQAQQKQEDLEKIFSIEQRAADLELLLQTEAQQKLEAMERVEVFKLRVGDLERELKEQSNTLTNTNGQMRLEFAETVQLCETLASEKDMVIAERDYLQQELGIFIEQTKSLEKEKATLLQELEEKREMDEFRCLEEGFRKEYETELQNEILSLKKAIECSDLQCQEFQNKLKSMSAELKERTEFAEELQHMSGKDLLQEVATLRRSLDDAEGVSRDTKKEWALLRSQNIALEEINMTLTASHENMEGEVNTLRSQLETEKSRYRMMQSDLQKELNVVFDENTKLTALLEGKVPKNLIDSVELERTVASLNKELTASREAEGALRVQLEELASFQTLPKKVDTLIKQLEESEQHRVSLEEKLNEMQQLVKDLEEKLADSEVSKSTEEEISKELQEQLYQLTEELQCVRNEKEALLSQHNADVQSSVEEMEKLLSTLKSLTTERDQLRKDLQHNAEMAAETQLLLQSLQDELQDQIQKNSDLVKHSEQKKSDLAEQNADAQSLAEEVAKLLSTVASLTAERDQLKMDLQENVEMMIEIQEELRKALEKNWNQKEQIRQLEKAKTFRQDGFAIGMSAQLEALQTHVLTEELEHVRAERDSLSEGTVDKQTSTEEMEKLLSRMTSLSEERDQLQEVLEGLKQEKQQLREELEDRMETLQSEMKMLSEKLECVQAERDSLLSEKESICQTSTEEMEKLLSRMTSLSEERDQLQEVLEGLKREKELLREELEDRIEMILPIQEKLSKQDQFIVQQQSGRREEGVKLQHEFSSEANVAVSALRELSSSDNMTSVVKETLSSRLHDSAGKLEVFFRNFQHFMDTCSNSNSKALDETLRVEVFLSHYLLSLPKPIVEAYSSVFELGEQIFESLQGITMDLERHAAAYRIQFKELVKNDLAVFEERRLQDVLLCRVEAPSYSINDEDFCTLWHHRLTEVLDKRQLYLQKMASILEKLSAYIALFPSELSAEISERERFKAHLQALFKTQPVSISTLDNILNCELDRRSAVVHSRMMIRQSIAGELMKLLAELELLKGQTEAQLREERSKSHKLLQALEEAPLTTELSLLKDNQQLVLQLQQVEEKASYLCVQKEQLEEAQVKANNRISDHEQAMQLLQTELQDSRAQVEEKENAIQTLKSKLQESEKNASPIAAKMENLQTKLFQMEVELYSVSDKHQQEIQRMTTLLTEKEDAMRKLREALRKSQQQGEESFLQGKDLHARLTNPRGLMIKSSIQMEKTKLEEEVKQLQLKIAELESLVSSQQAEIGKWKSRAFKLKVKSKAEVDKPLSPCTPTKRALPMTSDSSNFNSPKKLVVASKNPLDSPRKLLESPKVSLSDSPKSRLFDVDGSSDMLSRALPKQFFDNSSFLTIPGATGEEQWPQALKPEEICRTQ